MLSVNIISYLRYDVNIFAENFNDLKGRYMEPRDYTVTKIEGEYAYLTDRECGEELFIAMALLPVGIDVGTQLHYEMLEYTVVDG